MKPIQRKNKENNRLKRLVSEAVADLMAVADGVFMTLTQAGWGRAVVNSADVCAIDEAAAALEAEILSAWKGDTPCILAGDPLQLPPPVFSEGVKDENGNPTNEFVYQPKLPLLKRLDDNTWPCWEQKYQLRMAPGGFTSAGDVFYDGRITSSPDMYIEDFPQALHFEDWGMSLNANGMSSPNTEGTMKASDNGEVLKERD